ncbi:anti-sigma factor antagonist [Streptomyces sp. NBC_00588]|uniref:anti-sigma factor antagonist n=1 Tax=Streptomyces sp. NBC_00588 TaxID=2975784 RepID=UPI002E81E4EC|nr:anti-sigma factor antagonist [Streptomyces sp. NBC_00588]WUB40797.1 anti-sigma factor antagonist [Streptomyces sp. NBC_00588]
MSHHTALPHGDEPCPECGTAAWPTQLPAPVTLSLDMSGDRLVVTVSGELDLESDQLLQQTLNDALDRTSGSLELDLAGVDFCDCAALNVLLDVHDRARASAKRFVLRTTSPAVQRLLALTGVLPLFAAGAADSGPPAIGTTREADPPGADIAAENAQLHQALESHAAIDLARGMLMASFRLNAQQSWEVLVTVSQHSNTKLRLIADALLRTTDGSALPAPLADHLATAVRVHGSSAG